MVIKAGSLEKYPQMTGSWTTTLADDKACKLVRLLKIIAKLYLLAHFNLILLVNSISLFK